MAADVHDSLGHRLSLIALPAGALELSPTPVGQDRADPADLRAVAADTVGHLRETLTVLRSGEDAPGTVPPAESVDALVHRARRGRCRGGGPPRGRAARPFALDHRYRPPGWSRSPLPTRSRE
ncbi:histidine kinase dimerization/phosphoacceptor domain-containing protein [Streptomyces microflavus]|uniref:histidine kinase dimerization/phosphoacceptor domain-containing protein n=1 Tax=Streptomyces microflavus TaxID=1919 RepID=UPI002E315AE8|nr:histidine kinase dimerization/phosphoacceptor domain-containing protein [Streptomyces microflavus]WSA65488.1 histidine kinase dimerization/phosphoacceptor domain-containing protein [Streptomyces microflavus]